MLVTENQLAALPRSIGVEAADVRRGEGRRAGDRRSPSLARRGAARRSRGTPELSVAQIEQQLRLACRPGDERGLALRPPSSRRSRSSRRRATWSRPRSCCAPIAPPCRASATASRSTRRGWRSRRRISATYKDLPGGQVLGPDLRLHPPPARLRARWPRARSRPRRERPTRPARADAARRSTSSTAEGLIQAEPDDRAGRDRSAISPASRCCSRPERDAAPAEPGARRRGLPSGPRLLDPARLRQQPSVRRRDPGRRR